ncbi:TonB-dependent receptor [Bacteroides sp. 51]|nr:TonB-dependent receptor [Bacteroides sp. 51]
MKPTGLILKTICILGILLLITMGIQAQETALRGVVTDASTQQAIETATVKLLKGSNERFIAYTFTDSKGGFSIPLGKETDSLYVAISLLGYKTHKQAIRPGENLRIKLETEVFNLREVVVRPGRVWGRQDTINYDVSQFIGNTDESIKDVISKLPGVDIDTHGKISYNGKDISKFYVEGMDLVDGRYNQITKNLQARSVETVQVLDNHQPIKMLKDKLKVEDVAINLKLRPEFRDKWMIYLSGGAGTSSGNPADDVLWMGDLNAMQLSRNNQSVYIYKGNNMGNDATTEQMMLVSQGSHLLSKPSIPVFLSQPSLSAPLKTERLLFNNVHTLSANRLYKVNESGQLRINAGYTHDYRKQERGSQTRYFQEQDTIYMTEESHTRIRSDKAELGFNFENNGASQYLTNQFSATGNMEKSIIDFYNDDTFRQQVRTNTLGLKNDLRSLWNQGRYTLELRSLIQYSHIPSELNVNAIQQKMNLNYLYTDNSFSFLKKKGDITQRYTGGATTQTSNIKNGYSVYINPMWQANLNKWQGTFTAPLRWTQFILGDYSRPTVNPSLSLLYTYNYAWRFRFHGGYQENQGSITDFYNSPYHTDYRYVIWKSGTLSIQRRQLYALYAEYKNTVKEFFATLSLSHSRIWYNHIQERLFQNEQIILASRNLSTSSTGWTLNGTLSKGIFDWRLKASLNYQLSEYRAEQLSEGEQLPYKSRHILLEPKINWNPCKPLDINYESSIRYGGSYVGQFTKLDPLWNVVQKLNLYYSFTLIELGFTADHYYNDISREKSIHAFLIDASLRWKSGSWQIDLAANNLLNKKQYNYTQYSTSESYTSWINIRGREFRASVRYRF